MKNYQIIVIFLWYYINIGFQHCYCKIALMLKSLNYRFFQLFSFASLILTPHSSNGITWLERQLKLVDQVNQTFQEDHFGPEIQGKQLIINTLCVLERSQSIVQLILVNRPF